MLFHVEFQYDPSEREKVLNFLQSGALKPDGHVKVVGAWIAMETGSGYAILDSKDGNAVFQLCSAWTEYGQLRLTPIVNAADATR